MQSGPDISPSQSEHLPQEMPSVKMGHARTYSFAEFRALNGGTPPTIEQLRNWDPKDALYEKSQVLRGICELTLELMVEMNGESPALPPDPYESQLERLTRASTRCIVVETDWKDPEAGVPWEEGDADLYKSVQGYTRFYTSREDIPDLEDIPAELIKQVEAQGKEIWRHDRMFLRNGWRYLGAEGSASTCMIELLEQMIKESNAVLMQKVLVGANHNLAPIWMEAHQALRLRGSEDHGHLHMEEINHPNGEHYTLHFKWWCYPPLSQEGKKYLEAYVHRFARIKDWLKRRLALTATHVLPADDAPVFCLNSQGDGVALAELHPGTPFFDMSPGLVKKAERGYKAQNVSVFEPDMEKIREELEKGRLARLGGIYINGELDWLSKQGTGESRRNLEDNLAVLLRALKPGGRVIIRNTVARAAENANVFIELKEDEGLVSLFKDYLRIAGRTASKRIPWRDGYMRFMCDQNTADAFMLMEEYRDEKDWPREVAKDYTQITHGELEEMVSGESMVILDSRKEHSRYKRDRWKGKIFLSDMDGNRISPPPTSAYVIAEKVAEGERRSIRLVSDKVVRKPSFMKFRWFAKLKGPDAGRVRETVDVPGLTLDFVGWARAKNTGQIFISVLDRKPRPVGLTGTRLGDQPPNPITTEQVGMIMKPEDAASEEVRDRIFRERCGLSSDEPVVKGEPTRYLPAPGLVNELVESTLVELPSFFGPRTPVLRGKGPDFTDPGRLVLVEFNKLLWGSQEGDIASQRLIRKLYELLIEKGESPGPWLGERIKLAPQTGRMPLVEDVESILEETRQPPEFPFEEIAGSDKQFLEARRAVFDETVTVDGEERVAVRVKKEHAEPVNYSANQLVVVPLIRRQNEDGTYTDLIGVEVREDLPEVQERFGQGKLMTVPAFLLPKDIKSYEEAERYALGGLQSGFKLDCGRLWRIAEWQLSPGVTSGSAYLYACEVDASSAVGNQRMRWIELNSGRGKEMQCGNTISASYLLRHALGYLN